MVLADGDPDLEWPSIAYAPNILAWDVFFPLAALFAAATVRGAGIARAVRGLLFASAAPALAGLAGVPAGNMQIRNIGIVGHPAANPASSRRQGTMMLGDP